MSIYDSCYRHEVAKVPEKNEIAQLQRMRSRKHLSRNFGSSLCVDLWVDQKRRRTGESQCILLCYMHFVHFFRHSRTTAKQLTRIKLLCFLQFASRSWPKSTAMAPKYLCNWNSWAQRKTNRLASINCVSVPSSGWCCSGMRRQKVEFVSFRRKNRSSEDSVMRYEVEFEEVQWHLEGWKGLNGASFIV
jgi:hypothetical protein